MRMREIMKVGLGALGGRMETARSDHVQEDVGAAVGSYVPGSSNIPEGMSKNQWKKLLKRKKYEEGRQEWRYNTMI